MIRKVLLSDAGSICDIYNYYIRNTIISFEEEEVSIAEMEKRITEVTKNHPWIVYEMEGKVAGYAYATNWQTRSAYRYSAISTVYLHHHSTGKGIGSLLYSQLFKLLEQTEVRVLIGGISLPNEGSVALHEKSGFEKVAHFKEVGYKLGKWVDVGYWEKKLKP